MHIPNLLATTRGRLAKGGAEMALRAVAVAAGAVLLLLALRPWREMEPQPAAGS